MTESPDHLRKPDRRRGARRRLLAALVALVAMLAVLPLVGVWLILDDEPVVLQPRSPDSVDVREARQLVNRALRQVLAATEPSELVLSERELNGLASLAGRALPGFRGHATITRFGLEGFATIPVTSGPLDHFINVQAGLAPSSQGISITHLSVGNIRVPSPLALSTMRTLGNLVLGEQRGALLLDTVRGVRLEEGLASIEVHPSPELRAAVQDARARARLVRDELGFLGDAETIGFYHDRLGAFAPPAGPEQATASLADYLGPLFALASERSVDRDPVVENESLIYAVASYFGTSRFGRLTSMSSTSGAPERRRVRQQTTLGGRRDLLLHFLISAGMEVLSTSEASIAVGEFKELLDAGEGGSGYSFTDLAADRAGVWFATQATANPETARHVQAVMAGSDTEAAFFPTLTGLEDGLSAEEFQRRYGGLDGKRYLAVVADIDARIRALPVHHISGLGVHGDRP